MTAAEQEKPRRPRCLVVAHVMPWPATGGGHLRLAHATRGFARVGDVDLFALVTNEADVTDEDRAAAAAALGVSRVGIAVRPRATPLSPARRLGWLARGKLPAELTGLTATAARAAFEAFAKGSYDLAWFSLPLSWLALADLVDCPTIVDLHDLEDHKHATRLAVPGHGTSAGGRGRLVAWVEAAQGRLHVRRWRALHERLKSEAEALVVCSEIDRQRLGAATATVIPNAYPQPDRAVGRAHPGSPPTVVFQGQLTYGPNVDAAQHLVRDIAPRLWARLPEARIRLVGQADHRVAPLSQPRVDLTGYVDDMTEELARADVAAVPVRYGSGTRLKILEAFAHRLPVVATSMGAEGLDVEAGRHLLIADTAEEFASSCVELVEDLELRRALIDNAEELFVERYRADGLERRVEELARSMISSGATAGERLAPGP